MAKIESYEVNASGASLLISSFTDYVNDCPIDEHQKLCFEDIPLKNYALDGVYTQMDTAIHKCLRDIAEFIYCTYGFEETDLFETPEHFRIFFENCLKDMSLKIPYDSQKMTNELLWDQRKIYYDYFKSGIPNLVISAFSIIWGNVDILQSFNLKMAAIVKSLKKEDYPSLAADGRIGRQHFPTWLKNRIQLRESGMCYHCQEVAIPALGGKESPHLDHIVPLANGGGNDATNFVLSCSKCNFKKGSKDVTLKNTFIWPVSKNIF